MKYFAVINHGLENVAAQEIKEAGLEGILTFKNIIEFKTLKKVKLQSVRRLLISLGKAKNYKKFKFENSHWQKLFPKKFTFKIKVEGVKGQENRIKIAKEIAGKFFKNIEENGNNINPTLEMKNPERLIVIYFNQEEYFIGIDDSFEEINSRKYRVFAHSASFKGDLAYYFVRKTGFKEGEKLLVGFSKDGAVAIEAALFLGERAKIFAFDETQGNVTAARKNSKLAGVNIEVNKYALDELDVKYAKEELDRMMFHVTTKDEAKINEIYYQASYLLKKKGILLLIGRKNLQLTISDKFKLIEENKIFRGDSVTKYWILEKK